MKQQKNTTTKKTRKPGQSIKWLRLFKRIIMILDLLANLQTVVHGAEPSSAITLPEGDQSEISVEDSMCRSTPE
ncbi:MAG: hypothetical protein IPM54_13385 [Polyangiaceae bacterium]|nr:hypothetical protein [Polyangiaceae bacterium]